MLHPVKQAVTNALFPSRCLTCGRMFSQAGGNPQEDMSGAEFYKETVEGAFYRVMSPFLCSGCRLGFTPIDPPFCTRCGRLFQATGAENHLCGDCIKEEKSYHSARSAGVYNGSIMALIHAFKYTGRIQLARPFSTLLYAAYLQYYGDNRFDLGLPVPLHHSKLRQRGFNQSALILRGLKRLLHASGPFIRGIDLKQKILVRKKKTVSQTGLGREERKVNIKDAFEVKKTHPVAGKRVLLIDDVFTTGATTNECARALKAAGAASVYVLTLARAD